MKEKWNVWRANPDTERLSFKRATGALPEMECTKQLVELVHGVYEPNMTLFDVGCATGYYYRGLRRIDASIDYTGLDVTEPYIEHAKNVFKDTNARFIVGSIFDLPKDLFDIVICCNLILHLPEFITPVKNLLSVCKKYCFIRTLISDNTYLHKFVHGELDNKGEPKLFMYQNTYDFDLVKKYIQSLGDYSVELIDDEYNPDVIDNEFVGAKEHLKGATRIVDGLQISGNLIFEWKWLKITIGE